MIKVRQKLSTVFAISGLLLLSQSETVLAKKQDKLHRAKPVAVKIIKGISPVADPIETGSLAQPEHASCVAGKVKVDFSVKNFSFAPYLPSPHSTALDPTP
jgi:hypothetical protein